jgi:hypothetical protein
MLRVFFEAWVFRNVGFQSAIAFLPLVVFPSPAVWNLSSAFLFSRQMGSKNIDESNFSKNVARKRAQCVKNRQNRAKIRGAYFVSLFLSAT